MSSSLKPIIFYCHAGRGPNPPKVAILLELLNLPYELKPLTMGDPSVATDVKNEAYISVNPNGRVPAIVDPNNDNFIVWESAAVLYYLAEKYDPTGNVFGRNLNEKTEVMVWLTHQVSGLGPSQGQLNWFLYFHEKVWNVKPSQDVIDRYKNESERLYGVLEIQLEKQKAKGQDWLVLDRFTIADIAFYTWGKIAPMAGISFEKTPLVDAWLKRIAEVPAVKKGYEVLAPLAEAH